MERNKAFYDILLAIRSKNNATAGQIALAWVHHQGKDVVRIPGTTKVKKFNENVGAISVEFSKEKLKEMEDSVPHNEVAGDRYADMVNTFQHSSSPQSSSS